jgi:hypothetical protein
MTIYHQKETKVEVELEYKGKIYKFIDEGYHDFEVATFMWEEGNYSCDCNRSLFIQEYCDENFNKGTEMECGDSIKLVSLTEVK